jgi:aspartyl-tRNA(Asn)/glutamyl-tRNA(Gln) amidotransferase subunit B
MEMLVPNTNICPVCTGQPGALPVLSYEPMIKSLLMGRALKCTIHNTSAFDRKSYFYPDLPMGYQITQFHSPTMTDGQVEFFNEDFSTSESVSIQQIQMETDTAKAIHTQWSSLIDYNRAATPLIEIVTRPEFHSATQVAAFLKELQRIARYNDISDADMEKGQMRVDVNISISKDSTRGIRNEIKNMNSISAIMRAIEHEYNRQVAVLDAGGTIDQATRRRDDMIGESFVMRSKEDALDYRYFPEPDLPPLHLDRETLDELEAMPLHIPALIIHRCREEFWFHKEYINALINDKETLDYFLACLDDGCDPKETVKWIAWPMLAYTKEHFLTLSELKFDRGQFVSFLRMVADGKLISNQYKMIMEQMIATGTSPEALVKELWFDTAQSNDDEIIAVIHTILAANPTIVEQYRWWKETAIGFFVGQVMKALAGKIDPNKAKELLEVELKK